VGKTRKCFSVSVMFIAFHLGRKRATSGSRAIGSRPLQQTFHKGFDFVHVHCWIYLANDSFSVTFLHLACFSDVAEFNKWMIIHNQSYRSVKEEQLRLRNFASNLHTMHAHNRNQQRTWNSKSAYRVRIMCSWTTFSYTTNLE